MRMWDEFEAKVSVQNRINALNQKEDIFEFGGFTVVTNEPKRYGAAFIFVEHIQRELFEKFGENYYILPSSLHEVIVLPESFTDNVSTLLEMVTEINSAVVLEEDKFADHVYLYDAKAKEIKEVA